MERVFIQGNEAVGEAALAAGCHAFFGYPITPQNETFEWFAQKFPKMGRAFVQAQSEVGAINMVYGAAATGKRVITSTSGPGWGLMQEGIANLCAAELPCVIVLVQRGGTRGHPVFSMLRLIIFQRQEEGAEVVIEISSWLQPRSRRPVI